MDTWWRQARPAGRVCHRAQCWADMSTSRGEPGGWGRGARERQAGARLSLIQLQGVAVTPSPVDTLCASQANGLNPCSAAPFLSCRQAPSPLHTQPHTLPHTHTYSHTNTHNLPCYSNTPHTPSLTLTYSSHTPHTPSYTTHTLLTYSKHTHTHSSHPHTHKYINFSHTHTPSHTPHTFKHTHSSYPHTHTPSHTPHLHKYTHTHTQTHTNTSTEPTGAQTQETRGPRGSAHIPGTWSGWEQPRVPAGSVAGTCTHWEPLGP